MINDSIEKQNKITSYIKFDKINKTIKRPVLLLRTRAGKFIGKITYTNLKSSFIGKGLDELSFDIHKTSGGKECTFWDKLTDLAIIDYVGYGQFEASFTTDIADETIKHATCVSLETELGQRILREFHVNDEEAMNNRNEDSFTRTTFYNKNDEKHSLLHRVIADKAPGWSIGHVPKKLNVNGAVYDVSSFQRTYTVDGTSIYDFLTGEVCEESNCIFLFDTYNRIIHCYNIEDCVYYNHNEKAVEGAYCKDSVYYDKYGVKLENQNIYGHCEGIGKDTNILVSQKQLAKDFQIQSNHDSIKNCFYVSGGDDKITNAVAAANATGQNYIYMFDKFQYDDMSDELQEAFSRYINKYQQKQEEYTKPGGVYIYDENCHYDKDTQSYTNDNEIVSDATHDDENKVYVLDTLAYADTDTNGNILGIYNREDVLLGKTEYRKDKYKYIKPGLYTEYCHLQDRYYYLKHSRSPDITLPSTSAKIEYGINTEGSGTCCKLKQKVIITNDWTAEVFDNVTKTVQSVLSSLIDSRYSVEILTGTNYPISCTADKTDDSLTGTWTGTVKITRDIKPEDTFSSPLAVDIKKVAYNDENNIEYVEQKIQMALAKSNVIDLVNNLGDKDVNTLRTIFQQYSLTTLENYLKCFISCVSTLQELAPANPSDTYTAMLNRYQRYVYALNGSLYGGKDANGDMITVQSVIEVLQKQIDSVTSAIATTSDKMIEFQKDLNLENNIGKILYRELCSYIREDEYHNDNYISDGSSDSEILAKAKELIEVATKELSKACVRQYSISSDLNNIFALPLYAPLFDDFAIFNYIRVRLDDNTFYKLRIIQIDFDENSPESLSVTFSDNAEYVDGTISDLQSMKQQVNSIATSYSSTTKQAKQGASASNIVNTLREEGLSSANILVKNNDDEEVTIYDTGILLRSMTDTGSYDSHQARLMGSGLYLTDDSWQNVRSAIGMMKFNEKWEYGVIASNIIGELIAGNSLIISNEGKNITIDGNGITIKGNGNEVFRIFNKENKKTLWLDDHGNAHFSNVEVSDSELEGKITAREGYIGNWKIQEGNLIGTSTPDSEVALICNGDNGSVKVTKDTITFTSSEKTVVINANTLLEIYNLYDNLNNRVNDNINHVYDVIEENQTSIDSRITGEVYSLRQEIEELKKLIKQS